MAPAALDASGAPGELLERSRELAFLGEVLAVVSGGHGRIVLVGAEAGGGKTALLRRFCDDSRSAARVLWGACDALFTPRPLGPLLDVAEVTGGELEELVDGGARPHDVSAALLRVLATSELAILVVEDVH